MFFPPAVGAPSSRRVVPRPISRSGLSTLDGRMCFWVVVLIPPALRAGGWHASRPTRHAVTSFGIAGARPIPLFRRFLSFLSVYTRARRPAGIQLSFLLTFLCPFDSGSLRSSPRQRCATHPFFLGLSLRSHAHPSVSFFPSIFPLSAFSPLLLYYPVFPSRSPFVATRIHPSLSLHPSFLFRPSVLCCCTIQFSLLALLL